LDLSDEGGGYLRLTAEDAVGAARILTCPRDLPVHTEGWARITEHAAAVRVAWERAGMARLLIDAVPGRGTTA